MKQARQPTQKQMAVLNDLRNHAAQRAGAVLSDVCSLVEDQQEAYCLAVSVIGTLLCGCAHLRPGASHAARIELTIRDLTEVMEGHKGHEDDDEV